MKSPRPKIAVCLSGQLRTWKSAAANIKRFFSDVDVDFFIHSWSQSAERTGLSTHSIDYNVEHTSDEINQVVSTFNPVKCQFEPILKQDGFVQSRWVNLFYSLARSIKLKQQYEREKRIKYDIVVKCRFDLVFHPSLTFGKLLKMGLNDECSVFASKYVFSRTINQLPGENYMNQIDDCFFYTSSPVADYISHVAYLESMEMVANAQLLGKKHTQTEKYGPGAILFKALSDSGCCARSIEINSPASDPIVGVWFCIARALPTLPKQILTPQEYTTAVTDHVRYYKS